MTSLYQPEFFAGRRETVTLSASVVVPIICELLEPQSVLDVGCGQGEWLEAFAWRVPDYLGVDIAAPESPQFLVRDARLPLEIGRRFDLVVCLEVGEHLPESSADTLVDSLARHGDEVVFSAAVPGQEGKGHINCQPHEYWHQKFFERGFEMSDSIRPLIAHDTRVSPWYRDNIFFYWRAS